MGGYFFLVLSLNGGKISVFYYSAYNIPIQYMDCLQFENFEMNGENESTPDSNVDSCTGKDEQALTIDFSNKVVLALEDKAKSHNENCKSKVSCPQLKKVYTEGANTKEEDKGLFALARVNMFIRMKRDKKISFAQKKTEKHEELTELVLEKPSIARIDSYINVTKNWVPLEEDFALAKTDVKKYKLDYKFNNINDLYLEEYKPIELEY